MQGSASEAFLLVPILLPSPAAVVDRWREKCTAAGDLSDYDCKTTAVSKLCLQADQMMR
ncbi:hypothetical protein M758_1G204400 [Ceratodon purpureus]|nr:hypothetical protein M758_1G204400 [Ceratodon purpureus]